MILKNLVFLSHFLIYRQEIFSLILQIKYYTTLMDHIYTQQSLCLKREIIICHSHMTSFCHLVNYNIQQYSTKFTNCTYLSPYFYWLIFSIHQTPFIFYWELVFLYYIVEKCTSRHLITLVFSAVLQLLSIRVMIDMRLSRTNKLSNLS